MWLQGDRVPPFQGLVITHKCSFRLESGGFGRQVKALIFCVSLKPLTKHILFLGWHIILLGLPAMPSDLVEIHFIGTKVWWLLRFMENRSRRRWLLLWVSAVSCLWTWFFFFFFRFRLCEVLRSLAAVAHPKCVTMHFYKFHTRIPSIIYCLSLFFFSFFLASAPVFVDNPVWVIATLGKDVSLDCKPRASPKPRILWKRGDRRIQPNKRYRKSSAAFPLPVVLKKFLCKKYQGHHFGCVTCRVFKNVLKN